jgi:hypothetical protein
MTTGVTYPGATTPEGYAKDEMKKPSAQERYEQLKLVRTNYTWRARMVAEVTVPYLMPFEEGTTTESETFMTPKSGIGARGVNNLANKLVMALMPPGHPFFKLEVSATEMDEVDEELRAEIISGLSKVEQTVRNEMELGGLRAPLTDAIRSLIVTGNALLHIDDKKNAHFHRLNTYVVERDTQGNILEIILRQPVSKRTLPKEIQDFITYNEFLENQDLSNGPVPQLDKPEDTVDLFTRTIRKNNRWVSWQEIGDTGIELPKTRVTRPLESPAWLPLAWTLLTGESYGRGPGEEMLGDLDSNESLTESLVTAAAAAARTVFLVNDGGTTDIEAVAEADNGDFVEGREDDIGSVKLDKPADMSVAMAVQRSIQQQISQAFLLTSDNVRDAERVTAEEIRLLAQELETSLGGIYSRLAVDLQLPLANRYMALLRKEDKLPDLGTDLVKPQITTGLPALGRFANLQKYDLLTQGLAELVGPDAVSQRLKIDEWLAIRGAELGIDVSPLFKTDEQIAKEQQEAFQREMALKAIEPTIRNGGTGAQPQQQPQAGGPA